MNDIVVNENIKDMVFTFRGIQVMIDRDLAQLYEVETKVFNQAIKRNIQRFPDDFRFQLNDNEKNELVTFCDRFKTLKHYNNLEVKISSKYHDRFLIIDDTTYHIGASLKDLGKKVFGFSKIDIKVVVRDFRTTTDKKALR